MSVIKISNQEQKSPLFSHGIVESDAEALNAIIRRGWTPTVDVVPTWNGNVGESALDIFQRNIEKKYNVRFASYWDFHKWSVENYVVFWQEIWLHFEIISSKPYNTVLTKTGPGFLDNDWFSGAEFNFAENMLKIRDDRMAMICVDELGNEDYVTYNVMFEEVKRYASAFRKNGLKKNDTVACYMSNRKEAIFAMLATISIGAIWGGPLPYYGRQAAANIIRIMDPKFLITVDCFQDNGVETSLLDYLPFIASSVPSIIKVILVATKTATRNEDLSKIRNCVLLEDFLKDGTDEDMVFEQLSSGHPICIPFTSGTTGLPKGIIYSSVCLLQHLRTFSLHFNLKAGDVACAMYPMGWNMWDCSIPCLSLGITLLLYNGSPFFSVNNMNFWDMIGKYGTNYVCLVKEIVDMMEKMPMAPSPGTNLDSLKIISITASPVKKENIKYLQSSVKRDVFIGSAYGSTEITADITSFNMNMPVCEGETQVPALGMDLQCLNREGQSVTGQIGYVVVSTPAPGFLTGLWKDVNNTMLNNIYFSKYPGIWYQNDVAWVNPKTKGMVVICRSDGTLRLKGGVFGASDVYSAIHDIVELKDYLCVGQHRPNGDNRVFLFVVVKKGYHLTPELKRKIQSKIEEELFETCIPEVFQVPNIPYNLNNKRMESLVCKIVENNKIPNVVNIKNPDCLQYFLNIPEIVNYNQISWYQ